MKAISLRPRSATRQDHEGSRWRALAAAGALLLAGLSVAPAAADDAADVPASALKGKKVAYVACSDLNRWCREFRKEIVGALQAKGVIVTDLQDPYDPVLQAQHLDQAIAQKPDLIALLPTNARSVVPGLRRAKTAGIPVINLVGPMVPESEPFYFASIENNHRQLGEDAATNIVEGLTKEGVKKANILVITGAQVQPEVAVRMDGFNSVLAKYPDYKVVEVQDGNWDQGKSAEIARTVFAKYADKGGIQAAFGMADHMAAGIIQAAQQAGLPVGVDNKGLIVTASNCFAIGMDNIGNGTQYGTATQAPAPTATFAVPLIEKALAGKPIPKRSLYDETRITKENLDKWKTFCGSA
jgi:ABC-type sugar transport system substrate-binding protein